MTGLVSIESAIVVAIAIGIVIAIVIATVIVIVIATIEPYISFDVFANLPLLRAFEFEADLTSKF